MEGTGSNLRLPMNPPFFFESNVVYDASTGAGSIATGFTELVPGTTPTGNVRAFDPNLRPQFTQQWNVFVERLLTSSMSLNVGYVGHHATKLVAPVEGNQPLPGVGDPSTWAPLNSRRPLIEEQPLITTIATTAAAGRSNYNALQASIRQRSWNGLEFLASYTFSKVLTNNLGYYGSGGVAAEGAYWMNAYEPEWNYGRAFADARHNFVLAANYELPFGKGMKWGSDWGGLTDAILGGWKLSAIYQVRTGFPLTVHRRRRAHAAGRPRERAAQLHREPGAREPGHDVGPERAQRHASGSTSTPSSRRRSARGATAASASSDAPGFTNTDLTLAKRFNMGGERYLEFRAEAFNAFNHPNWAPPGVSLGSPNTFGIITGTVNAPRVIQFALKFYF